MVLLDKLRYHAGIVLTITVKEDDAVEAFVDRIAIAEFLVAAIAQICRVAQHGGVARRYPSLGALL